MIHRFSQLILGFKLIYQSPASSLTFKVLKRLYSQFALERIQFKNCGSTWRPSLLLCILFSVPPCCLFTFSPICKSLALSYITAQSSLCQWTLKYQRGCIWLDVLEKAEPKKSQQNRLSLLTFCGGHVKEKGWMLHCTSVFFFQIRSSFLVVKCRGKLDGLAKQRWMFSPEAECGWSTFQGKAV